MLFVNAWILLILRNRLHISGGKRPPKAPTVCLSVNQADVTLLGSSILFMSTQLPIAVRNLFIYTQLKENLPAKLLADLEPIVLFLNMVNYSTDFLVYAGMSAKYRQWIATEVFRRKRHAVKAPTHRLTWNAITTRHHKCQFRNDGIEYLVPHSGLKQCRLAPIIYVWNYDEPDGEQTTASQQRDV